MKMKHFDGSNSMMTDIEHMLYDFRNDPELSEKWKQRFAFFEQYGFPGFWMAGKRFASGIKTLGYWKRRKIVFNYWAFFFGPFYYFAIGLWRKATVIIGLDIGVLILCIIHPAFGVFLTAIRSWTAMRANMYYYEYKVKGTRSWWLALGKLE